MITNIGYDHTNLLGNTLKKIAGEKAGIIKNKIPVVISERQKEVQKVFIKKAKKEQAQIVFAQDKFVTFFHHLKQRRAEICVVEKKMSSIYPGTLTDGEEFDVFTLDLLGKYQLKNLPGVLQRPGSCRFHRISWSSEIFRSKSKNFK